MSTELGRVRGYGSAHHGAQHWWRHKFTAGTNLFLVAWFLISIARRPAYDYGSLHSWMSSAWVAVPMALLIASVFYHFRLGLQTVIEDYAHKESRFVLTVLTNVFTLALAATAIFSILKIAFGSNA